MRVISQASVRYGTKAQTFSKQFITRTNTIQTSHSAIEAIKTQHSL